MSMMKEYLHDELERIAVEYDTDLSDVYDYYIGYVELCDEGVMKHQDDPLKFLKGFMEWRKERTMKRIIRNKIKCKKCGDILESHARHDFKMCSCGSCGVDGGLAYLRRIGDPEDWIEMCEYIKKKEETNVTSING